MLVLAEFGVELRAEGPLVGSLAECPVQPFFGGYVLELVPVLDPLEVGGDETEAQPVVNRDDAQLEQIERAVERVDLAVREVAHVRR